MKAITPGIHAYLDYVTVAIFVVAPPLLGLTGLAELISYVLAAVHLALTLVTDFQLGVIKAVPFPMHGWVERIVGPVLVVLPFALGFQGTARIFYIVIGIVIIAVGLLTDYRGKAGLA